MARLAVALIVVVGALAVLGGAGVFRWNSVSPESEEQKPPREGFAQDRVTDKGPAPFDAKRAMGYLEDVCKIGTRISGSAGMAKQQELLQKHFEKHGGKVTLQKFNARQESRPKQPVAMANLIAAWHPERERRVIICCHYDTRPFADEEEDLQRRREPFLGANDGASGAAFLMELAHHMKDLTTHVGVDFVLFDGEEYIFDRNVDKYFFGSEHFAQVYKNGRPKHRYVAAVLVDMIAGKGARFPIEPHSWFLAGNLVKEVWKIASELKCDAFEGRMGREVLDDHLALNKVGIPAIDIIDFDYKHWHKLTDVPANCSGEGLEQVARVLTVWLQRVK